MAFRVVRVMGAAVLVSLALGSCGGKQSKGPDVPEGQKLCRYCCTTASVACSCVIPEVVDCPEPGETGKLPACAECRSCTKRVGAEESCSVE